MKRLVARGGDLH